MITLIVKGKPYTNFVNASVTLAVSAMADYFTFTASAVAGFPPVVEGDAVQVEVDGVRVLTGTVDTVRGVEGEGTHEVTYSGRDRTGDFLDSQINVLPELIPSDALTLKGVIEAVVAHLGLSLQVVDNLAPAPFNLAEDKIVPRAGDNAFDFVMRFASKRQALLASDADGNIVITQSSPADSGAAVYSANGAANILSQSWSRNATALYNKYISRGQLAPSALDFSAGYGNNEVAGQTGETTDRDVRPGRQSVRVNSDSYSDAQLANRAKWSAQLARAKATTFRCTVKGHSIDGQPWTPNTLVGVTSAAADISRKMLLDSATFAEAEGAQSVTSLDFVERDVYTINDKILSQRPVGDMNDAFKTLG